MLVMSNRQVMAEKNAEILFILSLRSHKLWRVILILQLFHDTTQISGPQTHCKSDPILTLVRPLGSVGTPKHVLKGVLSAHLSGKDLSLICHLPTAVVKTASFSSWVMNLLPPFHAFPIHVFEAVTDVLVASVRSHISLQSYASSNNSEIDGLPDITGVDFSSKLSGFFCHSCWSVCEWHADDCWAPSVHIAC